MNKLFRSLFQYSFVTTILWLGFVVAISFMETPLRFQSDEIPQVHKLIIGHLVFHGLNQAELVFGGFTLLGLILGRWSRWSRVIAVMVLGILIFQTSLLFTILDERTLAKIQGQELEPAIWHTMYILLEVAKVSLLPVLAVLQIRHFQSQFGGLSHNRTP